ncbi:hypothetical protein CCACVL1_25246 [Corchorus capsularis]|uniref:Uncharacterized protein n=1 Tax=Corchorus capsularis TaxID=210143 RepID=A0A1R3GLF6_COCAP|nr:hypothetical protein CCACVL1_25246 [Corchorus capsularis]
MARQPTAQVDEDCTQAHPIGVDTGVGGSVTHNARVQGNPHAYGTCS